MSVRISFVQVHVCEALGGQLAQDFYTNSGVAYNSQEVRASALQIVLLTLKLLDVQC